MGYTPQARLVARAVAPAVAAPGGPLVAVLAYSLTVVDMALVIGPHLATHAGRAGLAMAAGRRRRRSTPKALPRPGCWRRVVGLAALAVGTARMQLHWRQRWTAGYAGPAWPRATPRTWPLWPLAGAYGAVLLALAVGSVSGVWPFPPAVAGNRSACKAWESVAGQRRTLWVTLALAASSATALLWAVAWLECAPAAWDARLRRLVYLPLLLPSVLWVVGLHRLTWPGASTPAGRPVAGAQPGGRALCADCAEPGLPGL
jgi:putative thiamine transport system permease protein